MNAKSLLHQSIHFNLSIPSLQITLVLLLATLLISCKQQREESAPPFTVDVSHPVEKQITEWDSYTGRFESVNTVNVKARVSGYIQEVNFVDGSIVNEGQILFVIDPRPYQAAVAQAEGKLAEAKSKQALADLEFSRAKKLAESRTIAPSIFDERAQELQAAGAAVSTALATLQQASLDLSFTRVTAPISGRIGRRLISAGNLVTGGSGTGTPLTSIVSLDPIDIYFDIDEQSYLRYNRGDFRTERDKLATAICSVKIAIANEVRPSFEGKLDFLDNRLDASTGTLRGRARLKNADLQLNPGQFGQVQIVGTKPHSGLLIPDEAIASDATRRVVYVVNEEGKVDIRPVTLGRLYEGLREIVAGLRSTDLVIVDGLQRVTVGTKVTTHLRSVNTPLAANTEASK